MTIGPPSPAEIGHRRSRLPAAAVQKNEALRRDVILLGAVSNPCFYKALIF